MIVANDTTKQYLIDQLKKIEEMPNRTDRWRAVKNFIIKVNPGLKALDDSHIDEVKHQQLVQDNRFGSSKDGGLRNLLDLPTYIYEALVSVDEQLFYELNSHDKAVEKRAWRLIAKTFPEYRVARDI